MITITKRVLLFALLSLTLICCGKKESGYEVTITFKGDLTSLNSDSIYLSNSSATEKIKVGGLLRDGKCVIKGSVSTPEYYTVSAATGITFGALFLENAKYNFEYDLEKSKSSVTGTGATQEIINKLAEERAALLESFNKEYSLDSLVRNYGSASDEQKEYVRELYNKYNDEMEGLSKKYEEENPLSHYSLFVLQSTFSDMEFKEFKAKLAEYKDAPLFAENRIVKELEEMESLLEKIQVGQKAPDFEQNDAEGNVIKFSDVYSKNKVTMVDFWASWCSPCRAFNPSLVSIYKDFNKKGFEILAVSFDKKKEDWVKAIEKDKLTWLHVSDLQYWNNAVGKIYHVRYIPQNIFVNQEGIIIARCLETKEKIEELLKSNL